MIFSIFTLFVAVSLSLVSAYYSVLGLMAIFSAAMIPIAVMGITLEIAKITTTVWLHYYWEQAPLKIKSYLFASVVFLMLLTSLGSFGFLSKAHLDQAVPSGDVQQQVALFDEKIKTQRDNIESYRKALYQMDAAVDQTMSRTTDENGATKAANLRRSQQKERVRLQDDIDKSQKEITKLQEARVPVASTLRKVEAEVGPIKYIAAMIYGDQADQNMLEAAVRWVIIVIVFVFDPLAIVLILAATTSIDWARDERNKKVVTESSTEVDELRKAYQEETKLLSESITQLEEELDRTKNTLTANSDTWQSKELDLQQISQSLTDITSHVVVLNETIDTLQEAYTACSDDNKSKHKDLRTMIDEYDGLVDRQEELRAEYAELAVLLEALAIKQQQVKELEVATEPAPVIPVSDFPVKPEVVMPELIQHRIPEFIFGIDKPFNPVPGDTFMDISLNPHSLLKWTGEKWITIDKKSNSSYVYDETYMLKLAGLVIAGDIELDALTDAEQDEIAKVLLHDNHE